MVAQLGLKIISSTKYFYETDYMLGTILLVNYSLFINTFYLHKLDVSKIRNNSYLLNSQSNDFTIDSNTADINIQSAENCKGFSETVRQLPGTEEYNF